MADGYPKKEIDLLLQVMDKKMDANHREIRAELQQHRSAHEAIFMEQKKTNGRVKKLELWKAALIGATGVLTALVLPIVFLIAESVF